VSTRFYAPGPYATGDELTLPGDEARHLSRVLRLAAGEVVRVFDGAGAEFAATILDVTKSDVRLRVGERELPAPEPRVAITLAQAVLKGDGMDDVVRDAVMLGAAAIQPLLTTHTEVSLAFLARSARRERWSRIAVSSAKQCGRAVVPPILEPVSLVGALAVGGDTPSRVMLVEPRAVTPCASLADTLRADRARPSTATLFVGPEGGWSPGEISSAATTCRLVTLGGRTLRANAMALVAMSALFTAWGEY